MANINYQKCGRCKGFGFSHSHVCPPSWAAVEVWEDTEISGDLVNLDHASEETIIYETDAEGAARQAANNEFGVLGGGAKQLRIVVIRVVDIEEDEESRTVWPEGKYKTFDITVEYEPTFTAVEVQ